jgi:polyferredoxin
MKIRRVIRFIIQAGFFIFQPALFATAFAGVKYLALQIGLHKAIVWNPFLETLVALVLSTIIFGRYFCGYACAFGSLGDWIYSASAFMQKKLRKKVIRLPAKIISALQYVKYAVLLGVISACFFNVYSVVSRADPWELFAAFRGGNFSLHGKVWSVVTLGIILLGMIFIERFFCMFLCPMGAVFALLPILPFAAYNRRRSECVKGCSLCTKVCPASVSLGDKHSKYGDCFQCGKCAEKCPRRNVRIGVNWYEQRKA